MPIRGASISQLGNGINPMAMIRSLAFNDIGIIPYDGVPGATTFANVAGKGSMAIDINTGIWYLNVGTKPVPDWKAVTTAA